MKRVAYLVPEWPTQTHAFFFRELSALRELGNEVHLFSTRPPPPDACRHAFADEARRTTHYVFPPRPVSVAASVAAHPVGVARALAYPLALRETAPKARARIAVLVACAADLARELDRRAIDHLHVHSCADAAHLAALTHLISGRSYSLTLHGDLPVYGVDHAQKMARAAFVSVVTRPLQRQVLDATELAESQVPVITMGVDTARFLPIERSTPARKLHLVTVARLAAVKGHAYVLEAIARARKAGHDVTYTIAGEGPHRDPIAERIRELELDGSVTLAGSLGEDEVRTLLARADAFVLASEGLGEAAPVSVMEAMAAGLPVICSRIGGTTDMITDQVDGLLTDQRDVDAITAAVLELSERPETRRRLGAAATIRAAREFHYTVQARKLHDAISENRRPQSDLGRTTSASL